MIELRHIKKSFGDLSVLRDISLNVDKGDVIAILGPSGSGKTTLLRCISFLEKADSGVVSFGGEDFDLAAAKKRDILRYRKKIGFVFQSYNLFANKTALQNVTEGLITGRKMRRADAEVIGHKMLTKVGMDDRADYYPSRLSGGQLRERRIQDSGKRRRNAEIPDYSERCV